MMLARQAVGHDDGQSQHIIAHFCSLICLHFRLKPPESAADPKLYFCFLYGKVVGDPQRGKGRVDLLLVEYISIHLI